MAAAGIYFSVVTLLIVSGGRVSSAPQASVTQQQDAKLAGKNFEKTADLSLLINETLKINNKLAPESGNQSFRDDWTFDRVEYDLMDFLQELNARYRQSNKSEPVESESHSAPDSGLDGKQNVEANDEKKGAAVDEAKASVNPVKKEQPEAAKVSNESSTQAAQQVKTAAVGPIERKPAVAEIASQPKQEDKIGVQTKAETTSASTATSPSVLPISLASGDHDISESTWQYGIFDRFTRARTTTTTPQPGDTLALPGTGGSLDVRRFNSHECGLRSYRPEDPEYFPADASLDTDEIAKELQQRRQRPPQSSSFFQSHKKYHHTGSSEPVFDRELTRDDLENREKLLPSPPFDRYGEPTSSSDSYSMRNYSSLSSSSSGGGGASGSEASASASASSASSSGSSSDDSGRLEHTFGHQPGSDSSSTSVEGEFNLSSRRQWLQQQLGSTLQMLGFNSSHPSPLDYFFNQTGASSSGRENMMKMSASVSKAARALNAASSSSSSSAAAAAAAATDIDLSKLSGPEITDQELKARQDELKLEARVIGGSDARLGDSPWSVSLQALVSRPGTGGVEYRHYCGGTIISEYFILTAAHCLDFMVGRESRLFVVVGDLNWRMSAASMHGRRFGIERLIIHGGYKSTAFGHDIGLIRTKESMRPLKVNGRYIINSVCLPERNVEHSGEAELVGWGLFSNRNEMADSLQIADVPILPRPLCVDLYRRRTGLIQWLIGIELITEKQICAGTFGRGICQGDSGSALVYNEKFHLEGKAQTNRLKIQLVRDVQQRATIIGVVAFGGIRRCSYQSLPGVYMQTSKYLDWILPRIRE